MQDTSTSTLTSTTHSQGVQTTIYWDPVYKPFGTIQVGLEDTRYKFCSYLHPAQRHGGGPCNCASTLRRSIHPRQQGHYLVHCNTSGDIAPGHAIMMQMKWPDTNNLSIVNIYASSQKRDQPEFWATVELERRERHLPHPDFLLGDFNVTEDALDRAPLKFDNWQATDTLREIQLEWGIQDQWRHAHPSKKEYTYCIIKNKKSRKSRLDRIYSARKHAQLVFDWKTEPTSVPTDHYLIFLKFAPKDAPLIGNGHWTWFIPSLNEEALLTEIVAKGKELQEKIKNSQIEPINRNKLNPQTL